MRDGPGAPGGLEGLTLRRDWIDPDAEARLLAAIDRAPWRDDLKRRVQHYGWRYRYKARAVTPEDYLGPLPTWAQELARRLHDPAGGLMARAPDQLIVNEYTPGQGISQHVDRPVFGPVIASLSLGSKCVMKFTRPRSDDVRELVLPRRSLLILRGPAQRVAPRDPGAAARRDRRSPGAADSPGLADFSYSP